MEPNNHDKDKRAIDDPGLNQDSTYDHKDEENFDDSDDFHKNDDTAVDNDAEEKESASYRMEIRVLNTDDGELNDFTCFN